MFRNKLTYAKTIEVFILSVCQTIIFVVLVFLTDCSKTIIKQHYEEIYCCNFYISHVEPYIENF